MDHLGSFLGTSNGHCEGGAANGKSQKASGISNNDLTERFISNGVNGDFDGSNNATTYGAVTNAVVVSGDAINNHETPDSYPKIVSKPQDPVAIIGLALKFPQDAISPESFWNLIMEGRSTKTKMPKDRYNVDSFYHAGETNKTGMVCREKQNLKL